MSMPAIMSGGMGYNNYGSYRVQSSTAFVKDMAKYEIIMKKISTTQPVFNGRSRFFIVKSYNEENLDISKNHSVWATTYIPTKKIKSAFRQVENVILFFSVTESSGFQGVARVESDPSSRYKPEFFSKERQQLPREGWKNPKGYMDPEANTVGRFLPNMKVTWLMQCNFPFKELENFPGNPLNEN